MELHTFGHKVLDSLEARGFSVQSTEVVKEIINLYFIHEVKHRRDKETAIESSWRDISTNLKLPRKGESSCNY